MAKRTLNRERVLDAAVRLADEGGIESLSMRKLGQTLGVEAMSLYNHVTNKDDLLDGIVDRVASEIEPPAPGDDWKAAVRTSAISAREALRRHPWACALMMTPSRSIPTRLRYIDSLLARLRDAGFSPDLTYHAYHVLDAHIFGFSLWQAGHRLPPAEDLPALGAAFLRTFPRDEYPHLGEHIDQHVADGEHQDVSAFELGLDLILDGLEKMRSAA